METGLLQIYLIRMKCLEWYSLDLLDLVHTTRIRSSPLKLKIGVLTTVFVFRPTFIYLILKYSKWLTHIGWRRINLPSFLQFSARISFWNDVNSEVSFGTTGHSPTYFNIQEIFFEINIKKSFFLLIFCWKFFLLFEFIGE